MRAIECATQTQTQDRAASAVACTVSLKDLCERHAIICRCAALLVSCGALQSCIIAISCIIAHFACLLSRSERYTVCSLLPLSMASIRHAQVSRVSRRPRGGRAGCASRWRGGQLGQSGRRCRLVLGRHAAARVGRADSEAPTIAREARARLCAPRARQPPPPDAAARALRAAARFSSRLAPHRTARPPPL